MELWALDVWWSYELWMFGGVMGFGCLVELWALDVGGAMGFECLVE